MLVLISSCKAYRQLSTPEKKWVRHHPIAALRVKKINRGSYLIYNRIKAENRLDTFESGGKLDAFRHVYFMARLAQKLNAKKVRSLGMAHEKGNYEMFLKKKSEDGERPDSLMCVMDLFNNEVGINLGSKNDVRLSKEGLAAAIIELIGYGETCYMKRNAKGNYVTCDNQEINLVDYKGKWFVPKCIIRR